MLSYNGRLVFFRSVLDSQAIYYLSLCCVPVAVSKKPEAIRCRLSLFFWHGTGDEVRRWHDVSWQKICRDKLAGSLGIRRIRDFNLALLGKWLWQIGNTDGGLWAEIILTKHFSHGSWRDFVRDASYNRGEAFWQRQIWSRQELCGGLVMAGLVDFGRTGGVLEGF